MVSALAALGKGSLRKKSAPVAVGISHCFMDTVSTSVIAGFLLIFGSLQLFMYRKYSTLIDDAQQIGKSKLFNLQIFLSLLVPTLALIRFALQATYYEGGKIYGFMIVAVVLTCFAYPFSICLVVKGRYYLLPSVPTRGHGLVLLIFWSK